MDNTTIHPSCSNSEHLIDLLMWRGAPENLDEDRPVNVLVNHGYVVGFCPDRLQPLWSAYRVAHADADVDFERPLLYYDDMRLDAEHRIGRKTFGKLGGIQLNVGHMTPNEVINRQFGRLAQMETFLMSNMSPQYASLNQGVWLKLEDSIRAIKDDPDRDHVWAIVGPVFGVDSPSIFRGVGKYVPVPESYFCIVVDPKYYPYDIPSKVHLDCFIIPQNAPTDSRPEDYPATREEIEAATNLEFFGSWGRELSIGSLASAADTPLGQSRLMCALASQQAEEETKNNVVDVATPKASSIDDLIKQLKQEADSIQIQGRALTEDELDHLAAIQHTISWLIKAKDMLNPPEEPPSQPTLLTYKIVSDMDGKLKKGARTACNFWSRFLQPKQSIVIRLGKFTQNSYTIARAYEPYSNDGTVYGRVEFNTKYLGQFTEEAIAGTIAHELGHTLGMGWEDWDALYDRGSGQFTQDAIGQLGKLAHMEVERDGGSGTAYAHWDEERFDLELMTGFQDHGEHVLPVTIELMELLGHGVLEQLEAKTSLSVLLQDAASVLFTRQTEASQVDRDYFKETEVFESIPHKPLRVGGVSGLG